MARAAVAPFGTPGLDRAATQRLDERWVAARRADPAASAIAVADAGVYLAPDEPARLARFRLSDLGASEPLLLGLAAGDPVFAVDAAESVPAALVAANAAGLRDVGARLPRQDAGLAAYALALARWHRGHRFCAACGAATAVGAGGHVRTCERCGTIHHPRTDPVVITLVSDGERALLGRQPSWPPGRYSALAGFVEPGETLEEAVAREVREEAAVEIRAPRYFGSQPWPFPSSLMLGFTARHAAGTPRAADGELDDVRWFERDEVIAAAAGERGLALPPPLAIARALIDDWVSSMDAARQND